MYSESTDSREEVNSITLRGTQEKTLNTEGSDCFFFEGNHEKDSRFPILKYRWGRKEGLDLAVKAGGKRRDERAPS